MTYPRGWGCLARWAAERCLDVRDDPESGRYLFAFVFFAEVQRRQGELDAARNP